ncbi:MFS transporter [Caulobacter sp. KR2-114]|uniref:MFS transporter n=1 Tax=Caulobacter sp. KR2-114 TaxID=3400912 RepID=UPI003C0A3A45
MPQDKPAPRLGLGVKLSYGFGSVAFGVASQALSTSIIVQYLNLAVGISAVLVGAAIMVSQIVDAVVDPLVGQWSDGVSTRWGRRHPFMYASALPCALAFYALWHPPTAWAPMQLFAYMVAVLVVVRIFNAMYEIPSSALAPELAPDYNDRTGLLAYRWFFGILGATVMIAFLNIVFLRRDATHTLGVLNREGYSQWGAIAAVVILVSILFSSAATHRLIPTLSPPTIRKTGARVALRESFGALTNPSMAALMASGLISGVAGGVTATVNPYLYLYFWGLPPQLTATLVFAALPASILATVLAPIVSKRYGKKPTMISLFAISLVASLVPITMRLTGLAPPNGSVWVTVLLSADVFVAGILGLMGYIIVSSMVADVVEDQAARSGVRSEGLLFAANGLLPKLTGGIGAFLGGLLVTAVHFPVRTQQGAVDPHIVHNLAVAYLPITAVLSGAAIFVLRYYRIDKSTHEHNLATIQEAAAIAELAHGEDPATRAAAITQVT